MSDLKIEDILGLPTPYYNNPFRGTPASRIRYCAICKERVGTVGDDPQHDHTLQVCLAGIAYRASQGYAAAYPCE